MEKLEELSQRFKENFRAFMKTDHKICDELDLRSRGISVIGQEIAKDKHLQPHQSKIFPIFDEVFSDSILSIFFTAYALHKPAQASLRRALELGIAIVYLWDL